MKSICSVIFISLLAAILFTRCKKDDPNAIFNASFYTTKATGKLFLYIDDTYKGELPYFSKEPSCGSQNGDGQKPLAIQLKSGEYRIVGKDSSGGAMSSGTVYISTSTTSASGGIGGQSVSSNGDCVVIGLFE